MVRPGCLDPRAKVALNGPNTPALRGKFTLHDEDIATGRTGLPIAAARIGKAPLDRTERAVRPDLIFIKDISPIAEMPRRI